MSRTSGNHFFVLNFTVVNKSHLLSQLNDVWCYGVIDGKSGIFPRNFVKLSKKTTCISASIGEHFDDS
jgi:hypothetical protein